MLRTFLILLLGINIFANELDSLLSTYAQNSDLSEKTKLENAGMSIIYTRSDLEKMQARTLKDVLKSYPGTSYKESSYGFPDMISYSQLLPFSSSLIRVLIDDIEITSASKGSGFAVMGDMDLEYIDHIEIYSLNPSFEFSSEPTLTLIKLYTKKAQRDRGGKVALSVANRAYNKQSITYADTINDYSYLMYASNIDDKRKKEKSLGEDINRDKKQQNYLFKLSNNNHQFLAQGESTTRHLSINMSNDATPLDSSIIDYKRHSFGYIYKGVENLKVLLSYETYDSDMFLEDDNPFFSNPFPAYSFRLDSKEDVLSTEVSYKIKSDTNKLLLGLKHRKKNFKYTNLEIGGHALPSSGYNKQNVSGIFMENTYQLQNNSILTFGLQYSKYDNNGGVQDDNIFLARVGHTHTINNWVFKTYAYKSEAPVEPYVYNSSFSQGLELKTQQIKAIVQETKYTKNNDSVRFLFSYMQTKDTLATNPLTARLTILPEPIGMYTLLTDYVHNIDAHNKIMLMATYSLIKSVYNDDNVDYNGYIKTFNRYKKLDFYNELVYNYSKKRGHHYFDLNMGVSYPYNEDINIKLKGENLLNDAYADRFYRYDTSYIDISPHDSRVYLSLEYLF